MSLIKSRNWTKKEDEDLLAVLQSLEKTKVQATWNQIAKLIKQRNPNSRKTGKQCRERWANQLDPKIKRSELWTKDQNQTLFRLHFELGNKWSQICSHIAGRTDNCVKNHFYSTMRKGLRKINSYIENIKRKTILSKTFKIQTLNKILSICEGKNDDKFQFNPAAKKLALSIKSKLITLSLQLSDNDQQDIEFKQTIFKQILEFSRNCRKRKTKKNNEMSDQQFNYLLKNKNKNIEQQHQKQQQPQSNSNSSSEKNSNPLQQKSQKQKSFKSQQNAVNFSFPAEKNIYQGHNIKTQHFLPKIYQVSVIKQPDNKQPACNLSNNFSFLYPPQRDFLNFFRLSQNLQQKKNPFFSQQLNAGESFLSKLPDISKINKDQQKKVSKNESGMFDFRGFSNPQQLQDKKCFLSNMIQSQDLQNPPQFQNIGYPFQGMPFFGRQSGNINLNLQASGSIPLPSPLFSPYPIFSQPRGFSLIGSGWAQQSGQQSVLDQFKSTKYSINFQQKRDNKEKPIQNSGNGQKKPSSRQFFSNSNSSIKFNNQ